MDNAFIPKTNKSLNALGALIREWALDVPALKELTTKGALPRLVMDIDVFSDQLKLKGLVKGLDFDVRDNVTEVELVLRAPNSFTIVLPEPDALTRFEEPGTHYVQIPSIYRTGSEIYDAAAGDDGDPAPQEPNENDPASYSIKVDDQTYKKFVDPYMAAYVCSQCI